MILRSKKSFCFQIFSFIQAHSQSMTEWDDWFKINCFIKSCFWNYCSLKWVLNFSRENCRLVYISLKWEILERFFKYRICLNPEGQLMGDLSVSTNICLCTCYTWCQKNLGRLWLAYTELQGDFWCYIS